MFYRQSIKKRKNKINLIRHSSKYINMLQITTGDVTKNNHIRRVKKLSFPRNLSYIRHENLFELHIHDNYTSDLFNTQTIVHNAHSSMNFCVRCFVLICICVKLIYRILRNPLSQMCFIVRFLIYLSN